MGGFFRSLMKINSDYVYDRYIWYVTVGRNSLKEKLLKLGLLSRYLCNTQQKNKIKIYIYTYRYNEYITTSNKLITNILIM